MTQRTWNIVTALFALFLIDFLIFCFVALGGIGRAFHEQYGDDTMGRAPTVLAGAPTPRESNMNDDRELPRSVRVVMAGIGLTVLLAFLLLGAVLWANSDDGPCDGPVDPVGVECHRSSEQHPTLPPPSVLERLVRRSA